MYLKRFSINSLRLPRPDPDGSRVSFSGGFRCSDSEGSTLSKRSASCSESDIGVEESAIAT